MSILEDMEFMCARMNMCADVPKDARQGDGETLQVKLPFALDTYRVYFPGTYILDHLGNLKCARGSGHLLAMGKSPPQM